jgi:phosphate butyryltransferase
MEFETIMKKMPLSSRKTVAVAAAQDEYVLEPVCRAYEREIAVPVLYGRRSEIERLSERSRLDISRFELIDTEDDKEAALEAVSAVRRGEADILMKGMIQTADLLRAVLDKENGLRTGRVLSHVGILNSRC